MDVEELIALVNATGNPSSRTVKNRVSNIPIFDTTVPSTSGEPCSYDQTFNESNLTSSQVEPEPSAIEGIGGVSTTLNDSEETRRYFDPFDLFNAPILVQSEPSAIMGTGVPGGSSFTSLENLIIEAPHLVGENAPPLNLTNNRTYLNSPEPGSALRQNSTRIRTRNPIPDPKIWAKEEAKLNRMKGQCYMGFRRKDKKSNKIMLHDSPKEARTTGPVCPLTIAEDPKRKKRTDSKESPEKPAKPKSSSYAYYLKFNDEKVRVCQTTFLNTFGPKYSQVRYWLNSHSKLGKTPSTEAQDNFNSTNIEEAVSHDLIQGPKSGGDIMNQTTLEENMERRKKLLLEFLSEIPKLPSHYCRESTNRQYLQTDITSMNQFYILYKEWCNTKQSQVLSRFTFDRKCKELRLSLFTPKKDQCDICTSYKHHNVAKEKYEKHLRYAPTGIISYKLEFDDEFQELPRRPKNVIDHEIPPLFQTSLQIPKDKWDDLQTLKTFIPRECHQYYDNLPHQEESYKKTIGQQKRKRHQTQNSEVNKLKKPAVKQD
ncbi:hypothetical protein GE061_017920 [Apolygus lucorum]|uniref:Uncharacterized protein n=1 Tax=Apolygus lucorum TaxID=248454 RepID=A0A8S9XDT4_APOLU|nr:hypothetical protein GE061_017920 [Apolygus lucorum]